MKFFRNNICPVCSGRDVTLLLELNICNNCNPATPKMATDDRLLYWHCHRDAIRMMPQEGTAFFFPTLLRCMQNFKDTGLDIKLFNFYQVTIDAKAVVSRLEGSLSYTNLVELNGERQFRLMQEEEWLPIYESL